MWRILLISWAQLFLRPTHPTVVRGSDTLSNPWAGGWNSPQFSTIDINGDGQSELFVFERADNLPMLFERRGNMWRYLPFAETLFPQSLLSGWTLLRDYDGDGDKDIFTNLNSNVRVVKNIASPASPPIWRIAYDTLKTLYAPNFSSYLYAARIDIPAITDIDSDGDMDFLVYEVLGTLIEWHKNEAMEQLARRDTLLLKMQSSCWGHVFEQYDYNTNAFSLIEYQCGPGQRTPSPPFEARTYHAGGTLLAIDLNGDGRKDIIIGDNGPPYLIAGLNTGSLQIAHIDTGSAISPFPAQHPLYLPSFPAAYYEDVTGDGTPDLICANNDPLAGEDRYAVWMYPNTARADSPLWGAPIVGWLHNTMLDVGTSAHPTLTDLNRDGYPDLIISSQSSYTSGGPKARAMLLWGGPHRFTIADTNWLNLPTYSLLNPVFTAGDIDRNGKTDLLAGTSTGALWHWEEQSPGSANFTLVSQSFRGISGPPFAAPLLYDYDGDADLDLIIGARNGRLSLYRQESGGNFTFITNFLGQIEVRDTQSTLLGFARPALIDIDRDGSPELLVGNLTGFLRVYRPNWGSPNLAWPLIADLPYRWGKRASPTVWQHNDSTLLLVGNLRGGVHAFALGMDSPSTSLSASPSKPYTLLYEAGQYLILSDTEIQASLYNLQGIEIVRETKSKVITLPPLPAGVYLLRVQVGTNASWEKLWVW
ncbi:MAG: T9SS type A sorting domain-containing protein [Bacteroidia bacterium]|nr:T9SS type A sorting domain-containing protein [Bacteroidia bacterium]